MFVDTVHWQYLHPFEAAKYKKVVRDVRAVGRKCIQERIKAIESGEQTPNDILTHILRMACEYSELDGLREVHDNVSKYSLDVDN